MTNLNKTISYLKWIIVILILVRLSSLGFNVIWDTSEARYAEIGRIMYTNNDYITPIMEDSIPFWAKPPLSFWSTALSYQILGVNQFAARISHFLFLLATLGLVFFFVKKYQGILNAYITSSVLISSSVFLYMMGTIMTDPSLTFCITLSLISFYRALNDDKNAKLWGYLLFVGLGLGMLAKGPLSIFLIGAPIGIWVIIKNKWKEIFKKIPLFSGLLLILAIAFPWYYIAEQKTPGFLEYFIMGEHIERFLNPHWTGDLYGAGRGGFKGIIWLFFFGSTMPWSLYVIYKSFNKKFRSSLFSKQTFSNDFLLYSLLWTTIPLIFFSFSANTIFAYALPSIAPFAILLGTSINNNEKSLRLNKFKYAAIFNILILSLSVYVFIYQPNLTQRLLKTDKYLIEEFSKTALSDTPLLYYGEPDFSAEFYAQDRIIDDIDTLDLLKPFVKNSDITYMVIPQRAELFKQISSQYNTEIIRTHKKLYFIKIMKK